MVHIKNKLPMEQPHTEDVLKTVIDLNNLQENLVKLSKQSLAKLRSGAEIAHNPAKRLRRESEGAKLEVELANERQFNDASISMWNNILGLHSSQENKLASADKEVQSLKSEVERLKRDLASTKKLLDDAPNQAIQSFMASDELKQAAFDFYRAKAVEAFSTLIIDIKKIQPDFPFEDVTGFRDFLIYQKGQQEGDQIGSGANSGEVDVDMEELKDPDAPTE